MGKFKKVPSPKKANLDDTWSYHGNYEKIKELESDLQLAARQIIELERDFNKLAQYIIDEKYKIS
jgi:hypothetical protein